MPRLTFEHQLSAFLGNPREVRFNGLVFHVDTGVYAPHEDSFLLADASAWYARGDVLDLGCGMGIAGLAAARRADVTHVTLADLSEKALACAQTNAQRNRLAPKCEFVPTRLFSGLAGRTFDTILFNPPYLPTSREEVTRELDDAWNGGADGRRIINPFLERVALFLKPGGQLLFLSSSLSNTPKTVATLAAQGFRVEKVREERYFFETLTVLRAVRG